MTDVKLLQAILRQHPWDHDALKKGFRPILSSEIADERAAILVEDMAKISCTWPIHALPAHNGMAIAYYQVPDTDFGKMDDEEVEEAQKASGIGLNWGSIIRLSKVCVIGRRFFGADWPTRFKGKLLNGKDHFSFIEEMLWLSFWRGITNVEYEPQPFFGHGSKKRIDWRFDSCGQKINLEIKYRPRDWMRFIDGEQFNIVMPGYFDDVPAKFPARNPNELNLVAVTVPAFVDRSWRQRAGILLRDTPALDGVLSWAHGSNDNNIFEVQSTQKELIDLFFQGGDPEDQAHVGFVAHLWRKRDERRAYRIDEVPQLLAKLAADAAKRPGN